MRTSRRDDSIGTLLLMGLAVLVMGCSQPVTAEKTDGPVIKDNNMALPKAIESDSPVIPPIDAAVPARFETASFGLG